MVVILVQILTRRKNEFDFCLVRFICSYKSGALTKPEQFSLRCPFLGGGDCRVNFIAAVALYATVYDWNRIGDMKERALTSF